MPTGRQSGCSTWAVDLEFCFLTPAADRFIDKTAACQIALTAFALNVPAGTSEDQWITAYHKTDADSCGITIAKLVPTTVDGHPRRIGNSTCSDSQAFVFTANRVHVFAVWRDGQEPLLNAFLSTVKLR